MEDCASNFYIYLDLRQICAEHFEELPVQIRKEEILTIHDLRYVVVKELVKHFAEEFHPSFLVNPKTTANWVIVLRLFGTKSQKQRRID